MDWVWNALWTLVAWIFQGNLLRRGAPRFVFLWADLVPNAWIWANWFVVSGKARTMYW